MAQERITFEFDDFADSGFDNLEYEDAARAERDELYVESRGGSERCLCCGRYDYGDKLTKYGVHAEPCRNPNEE